MRIPHLLLVITALALSAPAAGQELQAGTRVRVAAPIIRGNSRFTGTVVSAENGRVLLRLDPTIKQDTRLDTISIPRHLIRRVEVSLGRVPGRSRGPAARTGAFAGVIAGIGLGLVLGSGTADDGAARNPWTTALWVAPALGAAGAGVGALIGQEERERWQTVQQQPAAAGAGVPPGRGVRVGVRLGV
jgi:hypothetical protein